MNEKPEKKIGETLYRVQLWPAIRALKMQDKLIRLVGEPFVILNAAGGSFTGVLAPEEEPLVVAWRELMGKMGDYELHNLMLEILSESALRVEDGPSGEFEKWVYNPQQKSDFEMYYRGKTWELFQVVQFVLEANYQDFIEGLRLSGEAQAESSPTESLVNRALEQARQGNREAAEAALKVVNDHVQSLLNKTAPQTQEPTMSPADSSPPSPPTSAPA